MGLYKRFKKGVSAILRSTGFDVVRPAASRRAVVLRFHGIQTVIDVGANRGQYGAELRAWGFKGKIISFEPTSAAFKLLSKRAANDARWSVFNFAVGAEDSEAEINVASGSGVASSLMPMDDPLRRSAPEIKYIATEKVAVKSLDRALADIIAPNEILMLKLDVQGFEHFVLRGATAMLSQVSMVECELSFVSLYEGQWLFPQMLTLLDTLGFVPVSFNPVFSDAVSGHCLSIDGTFARKE
jgi:FkbM family methyltransferase